MNVTAGYAAATGFTIMESSEGEGGYEPSPCRAAAPQSALTALSRPHL